MKSQNSDTQKKNGTSTRKKSEGRKARATSSGDTMSARSAAAAAAASEATENDHGGWSARLGALASQASHTVRHIPEKASDVQHGLGERVNALIEGAGSLQQTLFRFFPTLNGQRVEERAVVEAGLARLKMLAMVMDELVQIPVINKKVGLEPVLGMIPGAGAVMQPVISLYAILEASHIGAPPDLLLKMLGRHVIDFIGSRVPVVGPLFDAWYKAHRLNVQELIAYFEEQLGAFDNLELEPSA